MPTSRNMLFVSREHHFRSNLSERTHIKTAAVGGFRVGYIMKPIGDCCALNVYFNLLHTFLHSKQRHAGAISKTRGAGGGWSWNQTFLARLSPTF